MHMKRACTLILATGQAKDAEDDFKMLSKCLGDCSPNVVSSYQLSRRAERLLKEAKELKDKNFQEIASTPAPGDNVRWPVGSIVGRASEFKRLQELFVDGEVSIIGICGVGGVGKTMLLEKFYNDFQGKDTAYRMYWVDMDRCLNVEDAQNAIADELRLRLNDKEKKDTKAKRSRIFQYLHDKNFVLALDKVWKPVNLNEVGIPPAAKSIRQFKIILTTQLEDVCDHMEATTLKMKCLRQDTAWTLFWQTVGDRIINSDPWIANDASKVAEKCGGLPLALVTLGRAMKCKRTSKSWKLAIKQLDFAPWEIAYVEEELLRSLKPGYDNLADDKLKACFLYCCLFPIGSLIDKEHVICYCIGEGIIRDPFDDETDMFDLGHELLASLNASSLLEESDDDSYVKMHPIIRTLPLLMASEHGNKENKWLVRTQLGLTEAPAVEKWRGAERISLMNNNIRVLNDKPESPSLTTLLMSYNKELVKICDGFFRSMQKLRVLDLSYTSINEVPTEIGELAGLLYLNFSNTQLSSLPQEMENLVNLKALLLSGTPYLTSIPQKLIAKLSELRLLCMYVSYENWTVDSVGDGVDFSELNKLRQLKVLGISVNTVSALNKLVESNRLSRSVRELEIRLCQGLTTLSTETDIGYCKALKCLQLSSCKELERLEIRSPLPNLTELYLMQLPKAKMTCAIGCLQKLSHMELTNCGKMRQLIHCEDDDDDEAIEQGPEEKVISDGRITNYREMRQFIRYDDFPDDEAIEEGPKEKEKETALSEIDILPNLKQLKLSHLLELETLSYGNRPLAFPSLEILDVRECFKLKKIPLNAEKLRQIKGQKSWWNRLEWPRDDNKSKSKFQSYFKAAYL